MNGKRSFTNCNFKLTLNQITMALAINKQSWFFGVKSLVFILPRLCLEYRRLYDEKNYKYLYNTEKSRYNAKTCNKIIDENEKVIENPQSILEAQSTFYAQLYTSDAQVKFEYENRDNTYIDFIFYNCFLSKYKTNPSKNLKVNRRPFNIFLPNISFGPSLSHTYPGEVGGKFWR